MVSCAETNEGIAKSARASSTVSLVIKGRSIPGLILPSVLSRQRLCDHWHDLPTARSRKGVYPATAQVNIVQLCPAGEAGSVLELVLGEDVTSSAVGTTELANAPAEAGAT